MNAAQLDASVGARLWYEGVAWTVVEIDGATVLLRSADRFLRVHAPSLVGVAQALDERMDDDDPRAELDAVVLAGLTSAQRKRVEAEARIYDDLLLLPSDVPPVKRFEAAGERLGILARSARRRGARYAERGLTGLVDARILQPPHRAVAPEWDATCRDVLDMYTNQSNPTMRTVLNRTNALVQERHPVTPIPSKTVAYERLRELDKGRYTFGAAKQRRSVAERPEGVLGRLRADRPGQYVVLDTTRLDVFAMIDGCAGAVCVTHKEPWRGHPHDTPPHDGENVPSKDRRLRTAKCLIPISLFARQPPSVTASVHGHL